jgi:hypothetical protein
VLSEAEEGSSHPNISPPFHAVSRGFTRGRLSKMLLRVSCCCYALCHVHFCRVCCVYQALRIRKESMDVSR